MWPLMPMVVASVSSVYSACRTGPIRGRRGRDPARCHATRSSDKNSPSRDSLAATSASGVVRITVDVDSQGTSGNYPNTAHASSTGPDNVVVQDASEDGTDPDPDNDGNPTDGNTATPLAFGPTAVSLNAFAASQRTLPGMVRYALLVAVPTAIVVRVMNRRRRGSTA